MMAVVSLLAPIALLFLISRIGAVALELTAAPAQSSRFQTRSATTGVGSTTSESETIVRHASRPWIVILLMFMGSMGTSSVGPTLIVSLVSTDTPTGWLPRLAWTLGGFGVSFLLDRSHAVTRIVPRGAHSLLQHRTGLALTDFDQPLITPVTILRR